MSTTEKNTFKNSKIAVIVNGNAKAVTKDVLSTLDQILASGDLFVSRSIDEGATIAHTVVERGYGTVLTGGGDGTFTQVVTQVVKAANARGQKPPRFGFLRLGTGNSLAWVVGASDVSRKGLILDINRLRGDAGARPIRLVEVEGILTPFCGFGIDANVLDHFHKVRTWFKSLRLPMQFFGGLPAYAVAATTMTLPTYVFKQAPFVRVINLGADAWHIGEGGRPAGAPIAAGEVIFEGKADLISTSTIPYYGFGFRVFPFADEREDRMNLRLTTIGPLEFLSNFKPIWRGEYESPMRLFDYLVEKIRVEISPPTPFQIGGDAVGERSSIEISITKDPIELVDFYAPPRGRLSPKRKPTSR